MTPNELISVIIPNYNSKKTIKLCLDAIYNQDYPFFEVIVVDDQSTDDSLEIIKKYPCKILRIKKNSGPALARNIGAKFAQGKILFFVDSDLALEQGSLTVAYEQFTQDQELGAVCGIYSKEPLIQDSLVEEYRILQDHYWKKSTAGYITTLSVANGAIRRDIFFQIGGFNPNLRDSEDIEFGNRISEKFKILSTPKIIGKHDGDDHLLKILKNFCKRSQERVSLFFKRKHFNKGYANFNRGLGCIFAALCLLTMPFFLADIKFLLLPVLFFTGFLISDLGQYSFVLNEKGFFFLLYFILIHYLVNLAIFSGIVLGSIKIGWSGVVNDQRNK